MITDLTQNVIEKIKLESVPMVKQALGNDLCEVILYGSCARGDFNEDSDVDIALLTKCGRTEQMRYEDVLAQIATELAKELVLEAEVLLDKEMFKSANNRAYYAIEKALSSLLISHKIETKTHSGVLKMFNLEFSWNGDGFFTSEDYMIASEAEHIRNSGIFYI